MTIHEALIFTITAGIAGLAVGFAAMVFCAVWGTSDETAKLISYSAFVLIVALFFVGGSIDGQGAKQFVIAMSKGTMWDMTPGDCITLNGERYCKDKR